MFDTISRFLLLISFLCVAAFPVCDAASAAQAEPAQAPAMIANPASVNCIRHGGTLVIRKRADGGEYGICVFEKDRQCEEWAMFRGDCPVGGLEIIGHVTEAARYCVISGGTYRATGNNNTPNEQGTCTFRNSSCDALAYFNGKCSPDAAAQSSYNDPFAYCEAAGTIDTPDGGYTGPGMPNSVIQAMISQGIVSADAPPEFQRSAVWRCMNKDVWVCHFGANIPCLEKADVSRLPAPAMIDYCKAAPDADNIPAVVTGRATVYEWACRNGKPEAIRQLFRVDPQGYIADFWHRLIPQKN